MRVKKITDEEIGNCIVAKVKNRWCWLCRDCGQGGIVVAGANSARLYAKEHKCPEPVKFTLLLGGKDEDTSEPTAS